VKEPYREEIERVLISAMPTTNRAQPNLERLRVPNKLWKQLKDAQRERLGFGRPKEYQDDDDETA
jgi:hypothetical protein